MGTVIQSVARSLRILNTLSQNPDGMINREIAEVVELNISATHHLINTLEDGGYVLRNGNGNYCVGSAAGRLYSAYIRGPSLHKCLNDAVGELAVATEETAYACIWQNQVAVIDAGLTPDHPQLDSDYKGWPSPGMRQNPNLLRVRKIISNVSPINALFRPISRYIM